MGSAPSLLSMVSETWARPSGGRPEVPAKMTSSILPPRRVLAPCSPITQDNASTTLDLPEPLGPTTAVTPGSNSKVVAEANDLNPLTVRLLRCKVFLVSWVAAAGAYAALNLLGSRRNSADLRHPQRGSPAPVPRPRLADGAGVGGTVHELLALHQAHDSGTGAAAAFQALAAVGVEGPFEVTRGTVDVDVERIEAGTPGCEGVRHDLAGGVEDPQRLGAAERVRGPGVVELGEPECLVRIDIADARDQPLVQQGPLEAGFPCPEPAVELLEGKVRVQRVPGDVRGFLRDQRQRRFSQAAGTAVGRGDQGCEEQPAEDALVHETQLFGHARRRAQPEPDLQVLFIRDGGVLHQQLA